MRRFLADFDKASCMRETRSLRLDGMATSICLERVFWAVIDQIARRNGVSTVTLIAAIHAAYVADPDPPGSFASMLRCACLADQARDPHASGGCVAASPPGSSDLKRRIGIPPVSRRFH